MGGSGEGNGGKRFCDTCRYVKHNIFNGLLSGVYILYSILNSDTHHHLPLNVKTYYFFVYFFSFFYYFLRYYEGAKTKASTNIKDSAVVCNNTAAFVASAEEDVMEVDVICVKRANFVVKAMYYSLRPSLFQTYVDEKRREKREEGRE